MNKSNNYVIGIGVKNQTKYMCMWRGNIRLTLQWLKMKTQEKNLGDNRRILVELGLSNLVTISLSSELWNTIEERAKLKEKVFNTKFARKREKLRANSGYQIL